jgi:fumarate hydratase class II
MRYTEKAKEAFLSTGTKFPRSIIWAMGKIKYAAAETNFSLGLLDKEVASAIKKASQELAEGRYDNLITVDVFQTGSGTGLNMNVNEVIAEKASKMISSPVHPNDHVNMGQSSNDVVPTAIRMAAIKDAYEDLFPSFEIFEAAMRSLVKLSEDVIKPGRTHLRDALPVTMAQEFNAYLEALDKEFVYLRNSLDYVKEVPLGGTAVGTGINAHPDYPDKVIHILREITNIELRQASSKFRAMRLLGDLLLLSGHLRGIAITLHRLCQDIRLMYSGPFTGLSEIDIPQDIPGSSIMPGKVNPVTVEAVLLASAQIIGLDHANQMVSTLGEFELSMGIPLMGYNITKQMSLLSESLRKLSSNVISRIKPYKGRCLDLAERSPSLITVISPLIGYEKASELAKRLVEGKSIREALKELGLSDEEISNILDLKKMTKGGILRK